MEKKILITGISGSGKSTIAEKLRQAGKNVVDMDDELCEMYYKDSKELVQTEFENHDLAWVKSVEWKCDTQKLQALLQRDREVYCCGSADNIQEILSLFHVIILLQIDEETFRNRLTHRTNNNWGQTKEIQDWLLAQKKQYEEIVIQKGAVPINAHQDPDVIISNIVKISGI